MSLKLRRANAAIELTWCVLVEGGATCGWFATEAEAIADVANGDEDCAMILHLTRISVGPNS